MGRPAQNIAPPRPQSSSDAKGLVAAQVSNEIVFAVVGHVGSGNTKVAESLVEVLKNHRVSGEVFTAKIIKARQVIEDSVKQLGLPLEATGERTLANVRKFQDAGDKLREMDHAAVALGVVAKIRQERAAEQGVTAKPDEPVVPDGKPRAFIIDSLRHPAEVGLLRRIYGDGFVLVGVVCEHDERRRRLSEKYSDAGHEAAEKFMRRDSKAPEKNGPLWVRLRG